jgi:hypothetical protein
MTKSRIPFGLQPDNLKSLDVGDRVYQMRDP